MSFNGDSPTLDDVRAVLEREGRRPILLYVDKGLKRPLYTDWEKTSYEQTQTPSYRRFLERHSNTGVLLGEDDNLVTIDCDTELFMAEIIQLNPALASTLISVGERAGQIWFYAVGSRPHKIEYLKVRKDSPLALGAKKIEPDGTCKIGELRAEGGQSIIRGVHPCGNHYRWLCFGPPIILDFAEINWPPDVIIPWGKERRSTQSTTGNKDDDGLLKRAIDALPIDKLWAHFNYPSRKGNPVCSPFRDDHSPSFSVYDEGRRWKDHGNGDHGDSYDFYQRATGQDAKSAFVAFVELAGFGNELRKNLEKGQGISPDEDAKLGTQKPELILPSGAVTFSHCAEQLFPVLAKQFRCFVRDRLLVEIAYQKVLKDKQLHDIFQLLEPDALRSRIEKYFNCRVWREERGAYVKKPGRCTSDAARVLLKTDQAFDALPRITRLSAAPILTGEIGKLEILYHGYHDVGGGVYISHGATKIELPSIEEAKRLLLETLCDYDFLSGADKSRALASLLSPAIRSGTLLGDVDFPIDIGEANDSQSGKTFRHKLVCAIYGETPYVIAWREGGVGSLDESISSALIAGVMFIFFENFRGRMNSQLVETCLRGTGTAPARIPYRGEVQVSTGHINWQLSSNGLEATRDFVNRAIITRICKRERDYRFKQYTEGNILRHIKANQPLYLGAVFRILKDWNELGRPRTDENRHDFIEWAQALDWIVQNMFGLVPLLDGTLKKSYESAIQLCLGCGW
jgi:Bifunctional DNA primase/polymerase, N-terminal